MCCPGNCCGSPCCIGDWNEGSRNCVCHSGRQLGLGVVAFRQLNFLVLWPYQVKAPTPVAVRPRAQ